MEPRSVPSRTSYTPSAALTGFTRGAPWPRTYPASVIRVVEDGSIIAFIDRGGDDYWRTTLRLNGGQLCDHEGRGAVLHLRELVAPVVALSVTSLFAVPATVVSVRYDGNGITGDLIVPGVGNIMQVMLRDGFATEEETT